MEWLRHKASRRSLRLRCTLALWVSLLGMLTAGSARAHLLPVGNASLNIVNQKAYFALSVPVSVFSTVESCTDGVLTREELGQDRATIIEAVHRGLSIQSGSPAALSSVLLNLPTGYREHADESEELLIMAVAPLVGGDEDVSVRWLYWSEDLDLLRVRASFSEGRKVLRSEIVDLTQVEPEYRFFERPWLTRILGLGSTARRFLFGSLLGAHR